MADTMIGGSSGGSMVIMLRVLGISGTIIRATCDSNTVSGTIGSTGYLYLKLKTLGVWSVTASKSGYSFTQDVKVFHYGITECWALAKKAFYDCTPAEIQAIAQSGMANQYWALKDYHEITLTTGETIEVEIADFNHDTTTGGVAIPLTLIMKNCFNTNFSMGGSAGTGWKNATLRTSDTLKSLFPSDWLSIMTPAKKLTASSATTTYETSDLIWVPSMTELFSAPNKVFNDKEGYLYPIFDSASSRIKQQNGKATVYMTRSLYASNTPYYMCVNNDGGSVDSYGDWNANRAFAIGFCVG